MVLELPKLHTVMIYLVFLLGTGQGPKRDESSNQEQFGSDRAPKLTSRSQPLPRSTEESFCPSPCVLI